MPFWGTLNFRYVGLIMNLSFHQMDNSMKHKDKTAICEIHPTFWTNRLPIEEIGSPSHSLDSAKGEKPKIYRRERVRK